VAAYALVLPASAGLLLGQQEPEKKDPLPAAPKAGDPAKPAAKGPDAKGVGAAALATVEAFDLVYLKGQREAMKVHATLPRPFVLGAAGTLELRQYRPERPGGGGAIGVPAAQIARVELFEDILVREGDRAMQRRDFAAAFDLFARLVKMNSTWPGAKEKLFNVFHQQAQIALEQKPPDFDTAIGLCLQLRAEDRKAPGVQTLLRKACLGRADEALKANDYATAREYVNVVFRSYPTDGEATRFQQDRFVSKAQAHVAEAQKAIDGPLDDQRRAVGMLLVARHIWPDIPNIDRLIDRAKRNYPVLNVAVFEEPGTFEPLGAQSLSEHQACQLLYDWLFEPDESGGQFFRGAMIPSDGWTQSALGTKHHFTLETGHRWSDGKPVTAYDVEASLRLQGNPRAENFDPERARFMGEVSVEDPFSLSVELARPHPRPLSLFTIPLLPAHRVTEPPARGSEFARQPVGSGPFLVGKPDAPQQTKFLPNPQFRGAALGQPFIKEVNFHHYVKSSAAVRDMDEGKAHLMTRLDPLEVIRFSKLTGQFEVRNYLSNSVYWIAINHRREPLSDLRVRRAMLLAIDRQAILTQYFQAGPGGLLHRVITGPFPTHSPAYETNLEPLPKDETLAKQLIEEAKRTGKLPERTLSLKYALGDSAVERAASQIKKELQRVGIDVKTEAKIESDLYNEVINQQDFDLVYWRFDHRNVLYNIAGVFDPDQRQPGGTNFMGYQNPELTKLFSYLRQEKRPLEIWQHQRNIHRFLAREVVFIPLWQLDNYIAHTSKLLYRQSAADAAAGSTHQLPIHPLYLFRKTEGWYLEP
jgi:peptide/nickel transport system substrate-binding protein